MAHMTQVMLQKAHVKAPAKELGKTVQCWMTSMSITFRMFLTLRRRQECNTLTEFRLNLEPCLMMRKCRL